MSSDLKFSLFTTVIVLALIVAAGLTAALIYAEGAFALSRSS